MKLRLTLLYIIFSFALLAQEYNPDFEEAFIQNYLPSIEVTMDKDAYDWMVHPDNIQSDDYQHCTVVYKGSNSQILEYADMGIRLRGNTSRGKYKKSFKLHFEKYIDDQKFFGLKKLNLKAETNDPSLVREHLTMNLFRESNIPVARVNHIKLYINGEYMGLYSSVEQIDKTFLESRFGNKDGNLYKCGWGADLNNTSNVYDNGIYELKTNEDENDRTKLYEFVDFLRSSYNGLFESEIESYFNVEGFIRQLAVEVMSGHWDAYSYNKNNFYLYYNTETSKFEFIPYDTDNTYGIDWINRDWADRDIYDWAKHGDSGRPLYSRILSIQKYKVQFTKEVYELLQERFTLENQMKYAYEYKSLISGAVENDNYYSADFGFRFNDFEGSFTSYSNNHVKYGIEDYIAKRIISAEKQLKYYLLPDEEEEEIIYNWTHFPQPLKSGNSLSLSVGDENLNQINVDIIDLSGRLISSEAIIVNDGKSSVQTENLNTGLYFIRVSSSNNENLYTEKLIIN